MEDVTKEIIVESRKLPIERNKVFFSNYDGKGYGGNCKYIAEEIMRGQYPMKLIWAVSDKNIQGIPTQIERVQLVHRSITGNCLRRAYMSQIQYMVSMRKREQVSFSSTHGTATVRSNWRKAL